MKPDKTRERERERERRERDRKRDTYHTDSGIGSCNPDMRQGNYPHFYMSVLCRDNRWAFLLSCRMECRHLSSHTRSYPQFLLIKDKKHNNDLRRLDCYQKYYSDLPSIFTYDLFHNKLSSSNEHKIYISALKFDYVVLSQNRTLHLERNQYTGS